MEGDFSIDEKSLKKIRHDRATLLKYIEVADNLTQTAVAQGNFPDVIKYSGLLALAKRDLESLDESLQEDLAKESERLVSPDYALETKLVHKFDVDQFHDRIKELFDYYTTSALERKLAPYFPLIQSSGMGKTKIFFEFKRSAAQAVILLECTKRIPQDRKLSSHFTDWFVVPSEQGDKEQMKANRKLICDKLLLLVEREREERKNDSLGVVILFDKAQHLLDNNGFPVQFFLALTETNYTVFLLFYHMASSQSKQFKNPKL